ncbi:endo-1,4-beta-xylanase [Halorhabdus sp. BNX81]|uniref:endo-1,4-beta-xylanase n=1 Tax=Halorhabdus sp. BNX81 TaxID=2980181 RepID=UPI0023DD28D5|nr:endo-1,4-beta-xylanase [Halorhabdus sp. BNX81]WEL20682.1 Endo-1,4-beta-xylanase, glycosyl hydrolase family 10 [Halorhabdus sp. BNX81]
MTDDRLHIHGDRRTFLKSVGALGAATAVGSGSIGSVVADNHLDDYHQTLRSELQEKYDLPAGSFRYGATEQETIDSFEFQSGDSGTLSEISVDNDSVPITQGVRIEVNEEGADSWTYSYQRFLEEQSFEEGDVLLGVGYIRSESENAETEGFFKYRYVDEDGNTQYQDANYITGTTTVQPGEEWTRYYFPIEVGAQPGTSRTPYVEFWLGMAQQTVEFGGMALIDYSDADVAVGDLPSGAPSTGDGYEMWSETDDAYYSELISDLKGYNLGGAGQFVNGTTEAAVFDTYELGGGSADLANQQSLDVSGDDVPFSEATRIEVTEPAEDDWLISFKSYGNRGLSSGDVLLGVAYMRDPEGDSTITYKSTGTGNESSNYVTKSGPSLTGEWKRYYFPIEYGSDAASGEWWTEIWLGAKAQTVDIGGLAVIDFAQGVAVGDLPAWEEAISEQWEEEADARIEDHRKTDFGVEVVDDGGNAVEGADVEVAMQEHDFNFGTEVTADHLIPNTEPGDKYREVITENFNTAVLGNHHKWRFFEEAQDTADAATEWLVEQDMSIRGHVCLWAAVDSYAVPADVVAAMGREWSEVDDPELDPEYVRDRTFEHIEEIINHYADFKDYGSVIDEWEVHNETTHVPGFIKAVRGVGPDEELDINPVEAPVLAEWHNHAEDVAPDDVGIAINDYNTIEGPIEQTRQDHNRMAEFLVEEGVGLDGIGLQSHFNQSMALTPTEIWDALELYTGHGAGIRITEFDMADETWTEADKATFFKQFLKVTFSHPNVDTFMVWGFKDDLHWRDDAPFFDAQWNEKPSFGVWQDLVFDEWWTEKAGSTDADGVYATDGFKGTYRITATHGEQTAEREIEIDDSTDTVTVTIGEVEDGDGEEDDGADDGEETAPGTLPGGSGPSQDPDGDGLHEDVNGDGNANIADVRSLLNNRNHESVRANADAYDFDGDGSVDVGDALALFRKLYQ